jgi:hypothetical protein
MAYIIALIVFLCGSPSEAITQPYSNRVIVSGPSACAIDNAYLQWLTGPLDGNAPAASSFSAVANATANPITVTFASTSGNIIAKTNYSIASSTCVDSSWPGMSRAFQYPAGRATLSGSYVLALVAADIVHNRTQPTSLSPADNFAYTSSLYSGVVIVTTSKGDFNVGYYQYYDAGMIIIGCYKEQHYLVTATTFAASQTSAGCPG